MIKPLPPYGPMDITRHALHRSRGVHIRVFYRGEDVTDRCQYADDTPGRQVAHLFKLDANGRKYVDLPTNVVAMETVEGDVQMREAT